MNTRILVVEDDENLGNMLSDYLRAKGYEVDLERDGEKGYSRFSKTSYDLCLLDVMMPKKDGFTLAKEIRRHNAEVPILFLTAKSMEEDIKEGFRSGADDYISKPFSMEVLLLRLEAVLKRATMYQKKKADKKEFNIKGFSFFPEKRIIKNGSFEKKLTSKENELLKLLCQYEGEVVDRNDALNLIWGDDNYFNSRSMDVYVTKLRKIFKEHQDIQILNSHGKGFKLLVD